MMAMNSHNSTAICITVLDVNDNYPVFTDQSYNISINEDISVGRTVLTVTVRDDDVVSILCIRLYNLLIMIVLRMCVSLCLKIYA